MKDIYIKDRQGYFFNLLTTVVFIFLPSLNLTKMKKIKHREHPSSKFAEFISESEIDVRIVDRVLANTTC